MRARDPQQREQREQYQSLPKRRDALKVREVGINIMRTPD